MSTYGSVAITGPNSRIARIVQSAEPGDLAARANAAIAALPAGYIVVALALAGAGDGHTFTITIEAGAPADTTGGFQAAPPVITCFLAGEQSALLLSRAPAGPAAGTFADTQVAGASKGTRFMGMVVAGVVAQGNVALGAGLVSWCTDDGDPANGFPRLFNAPNGVVDENQNQYPLPYNCTVSQLTCRSTKGNVAANRQFTMRKATIPGAGVNQTLTATIAVGTSLATDNANSFAANQGDMLSLTNIDEIGAGEWIVCSVRLTPT